MTEKDKRLIEMAQQIPYTEHYLVSRMEKQADTEEARETLRRIASRLYHEGEYRAGCI